MEEVKRYAFTYSLTARNVIKKLPPAVKPTIKNEIEGLVVNPYQGKELIDDLAGFRSLVIGKYRVIYRLDEDARVIQVYFIGHRRDVYTTFKELLLAVKK